MLRPLHTNPVLSERDLAACRDLLSNGSRTFYAASFLLPARIRDPATALYAFCRVADDAIDVSGGSDAALVELRQRLDLVYAGTPLAEPVDRALAATVAQFEMPRALLDALIEGFEWDARGMRYETLGDLQGYGARVAGTVGAMMAVLMGARSAEQIARACDLGIAMQLTNIARDVGEDARAGRIYLPLSWMREVGIEPEAWLAAPCFSPALASVIERLLEAADEIYERAEAGIARLPSDCRPGIYAARFLYAGIGHELARSGLDAVSRRAVVPATRKLRLLARALSTTSQPARLFDEPPLDAAMFLVDAVTSAPTTGVAVPPAAERGPSWWNIYGRLGRLVELVHELEQRDRVRARTHVFDDAISDQHGTVMT